ncbi:MAG: conjugal transfer protein TraF [Rhodospirillaceae bacterium]|nr:conjugal transfer protein TraF [Rhodospirillaceae bacterium]
MTTASRPALWLVLIRMLAATSVWAALGAPAAGGDARAGDTRAGDTRAGEWRSWCADSGAGASLGWHFYCDREQERQDVEPPPAPPDPRSSEPTTPATERILALRRALEEARAEAILDPTPEKVTAYLRLQQETLQRAAAFSDAFRRTVWASPELDYTLKRPVGALAKRVWSDERRMARDAALARLGDRYGLIYLGHAGCAGCRVFGPLLHAFATRHGLDVLPVSLTGEALEGWPEAVADQGRAARLGLGNAPVPALVLFDTATKRVLPVGFGVMAEDEMAERIFALTALEPGHDY